MFAEQGVLLLRCTVEQEQYQSVRSREHLYLNRFAQANDTTAGVIMTKFLVLYRSDATAAEQMANATEEEAAAGMQAWMEWFGKAGSAVVDGGSPTMGGDGTIGGYSILEAEDQAAVEALLADHPHRQVGTFDVLEFLAMPGM